MRNQEGAYVAISYVWGQSTTPVLARINGRDLPIGRNISQALRHLRRKDTSIRIWADAVCIDQQNSKERNHQVQQMRNIYAPSSETIVYLGDNDGSNTTYSAWNFLERRSEWALDRDGNRDYERPAALENELVDFRGDISDAEISVLSWQWFLRVWVLQEVVVSREVSIQCGHRRIPWDDFCKIILLSPRYHDQYGFSLQAGEKVDLVRSMFHARRQRLENYSHTATWPSWYPSVMNYARHGNDIVDMLARTRQLEASDPRDKIFALLGISGSFPGSDIDATIDYDKSVAEVYADFARDHMQASKSFDMLSYVRHTVSFRPFFVSPFGSLPSWVPNWDCSRASRIREVERRVLEGRKIQEVFWSRKSQRLKAFDEDEVWEDLEKSQRMEPDLPLSNSMFFGPNILDTLEPETKQDREKREVLAAKSMRWTGIANLRLEVVGSPIGRVLTLGPWITLRGVDEVSFQHIRNRFVSDPDEMHRAIIRRWKGILTQKQRKQWMDSHIDPFPPTSWFGDPAEAAWEGLDGSPDLGPNTIESHLFARGRQTASWTGDRGKETNSVTDKTSVVESKRIGTYIRTETEALHSNILRVILPPGAKETDWVVYVHGARVPFVLRRMGGISTYTAKAGPALRSSEASGPQQGMPLLRCKLVGECLINEFETFVEETGRLNMIFSMD